jgi:uncharacterized phage protein (TIGR01671 family)
MREIKFRAWDKKYNSWFYSSHLPDTEGLAMFWKFIHEHSFDHEIMQYTGLRDRNNREIYEGDIVKDEYGKKYPVIWDGIGWTLEGFYRPKQDEPGSAFSEDAIFEIIGNIYENPELLAPLPTNPQITIIDELTPMKNIEHLFKKCSNK